MRLDKNSNNQGEFSAGEFVSCFENEGPNVTCDEEHYNAEDFIPPFFDEEKFKRGQQFYHKHIFAMFFAKLLGLVTLLSLPTVKKLVMTNKSSTPATAYKRYVSTIFHMHAWYTYDFRPGSKTFLSVNQVRRMHNAVSKMCPENGLKRINQQEMALTAFGFMGYILIRPKEIGIHDAKREEFEAFVYFWRVICYALGVEDRFNICRESLEETREICELLTQRILLPSTRKYEGDFVKMSNAMLNGVSVTNPCIEANVFMNLLFKILHKHPDVISAQDFVFQLQNIAKNIPCDNSAPNFSKEYALPKYYDKKKTERGQKFFRDNIVGVHVGMLFGLVTIFAIPSIRKILDFTRESSNTLSAYKRYYATVIHIYIWSQSSFIPGSKLWESIYYVKNKHNTTSNKSSSAGMRRITQYDMVVTQWAFVGYILCRPKSVGIYNANVKDLEGFLHMWRIFGQILGIQDRFNICRDTIKETKEICRVMTQKILKPEFDKFEKPFLEISTNVIRAAWYIIPLLEPSVVLIYARDYLLRDKAKEPPMIDQKKIKLTITQRLLFEFNYYALCSNKYWPIRIFWNYIGRFSMWLLINYPFLAYWKFGKANSKINFLYGKQY